MIPLLLRTLRSFLYLEPYDPSLILFGFLCGCLGGSLSLRLCGSLCGCLSRSLSLRLCGSLSLRLCGSLGLRLCLCLDCGFLCGWHSCCHFCCMLFFFDFGLTIQVALFFI